MPDENAVVSEQPSVSSTISESVPTESVPQSPTPQSLPPSPQINSRHIRTTESEDGQVLFYGRDGSPLKIPESKKQEYQALNESVAQMEKDDLLPPSEEEKDEATSDEVLETVRTPTEAPAVSNKRDKDTERAYHEGQQQLKKITDELTQTKQLNQQALSALEVIYEIAQRNPQQFQQLFGAAVQQPHLPSTPEEMQELNEDPNKFNDYVRTLIREEAAKTVYSDPDFVRLKVGYNNLQQVNSFIKNRFEGNNKHPDLLAAQPYLERTLAEYQQAGQPITLEKAYQEYLRAKEHFAPAGKVGEAGKSKTNPSKNGSPESSPTAKAQNPLPSKYPGVAGRTYDSRAGMQGMTRRQKIEEFGRRILAGQPGSRFSR